MIASDSAVERSPFSDSEVNEFHPDATAVVQTLLAGGDFSDCSKGKQLGLVLASAIYHGALLSADWLRPWLNSLPYANPASAGLSWVYMRAQRLERSADPKAFPRRWFIDPVTRGILASLPQFGKADLSGVEPDQLLADFAGCCSKSLSANFINLAAMRWRLRMPGVLVAYALGKGPSVSVPTAYWERLLEAEHGLHDVCRDNSDSSGDSTEPEVPAPWSPELFWLAKLNYLVRSQWFTGPANHEPWRPKAAALRALLREQGSDAPMASLLTKWMLNQLYAQRVDLTKFDLIYTRVIPEWATTGRLDAFNLASSYRAALRLAAPTLRTQAPGNHAPDGRVALRRAIDSFQWFLAQRHEDLVVPAEVLDDLSSNTTIRAELVTINDVIEAAARCGRGRYGRTVLVLLLLSFRCGLRLEEALGLEIDDIREAGGLLEIRIQRNRYRDLKTPHSERVLPADILMSPTELKLLRQVWNERQLEIGKSAQRARKVHSENRSIFLRKLTPKKAGFDREWSEEHFDPLSKRIDQKLSALLAEVVHQPVRYHTLRHSFGSFLLAAVLKPVGENNAAGSLPAHLLRPTIAEDLADRLTGRGRIGQGAVHAISHLLGHKPVNTTLQWYAHLLDLTVAFYVDREAHRAADAWAPRKWPGPATAILDDSDNVIRTFLIAESGNAIEPAFDELIEAIKIGKWPDQTEAGEQGLDVRLQIYNLAELSCRFKKMSSLRIATAVDRQPKGALKSQLQARKAVPLRCRPPCGWGLSW